MSRYNHFSVNKYDKIPFGEIRVGEKFRMSKFINGRRRFDIIMIKTSALSYQELKSKKDCRVLTANFEVSRFDSNSKAD